MAKKATKKKKSKAKQVLDKLGYWYVRNMGKIYDSRLDFISQFGEI
jgi:hypothetical protein